MLGAARDPEVQQELKAPPADIPAPPPAISRSASRGGREHRADRSRACQNGSLCHVLSLDVCKT